MSVLVCVDKEKELKKIKTLIDIHIKDEEVYYAVNGTVAFDLLDRFYIDVIVSDITVAGMPAKSIFEYASLGESEPMFIVMADNEDVLKVVDLVNQMKLFRTIIRPVKIADDICTPIIEALDSLRNGLNEKKAFNNVVEENNELTDYIARNQQVLKEQELLDRLASKIIVADLQTCLKKKDLHLSDPDSKAVIKFEDFMVRKFASCFMDISAPLSRELSLQVQKYNDEQHGKHLEGEITLKNMPTLTYKAKLCFLMAVVLEGLCVDRNEYDIKVVIGERNEQHLVTVDFKLNDHLMNNKDMLMNSDVMKISEATIRYFSKDYMIEFVGDKLKYVITI